MRKFAALLTLFLWVLAIPASAQITVPYTFTVSINTTQLNTNFSTIADGALKRNGGTVTGNIIVNGGVTIDGVDISAVLGGSGTPTFSTIVVTSAGAGAIDVTGGINAGSGNVGIVDTSGRIPALSSTYFANLSGANLTALAEANITDGSVFPRLAAQETITNHWTFEHINPLHQLRETDASADSKLWRTIADSEQLSWQTLTDAGVPTTYMRLGRSGGTPTQLNLAENDTGVAIGGGTAFKEILSGTATYDPPSLTDDSSAVTAVSVTGVTSASICFAVHPAIGNQAIFLVAVPTAGSVYVSFYNGNGSTVDLASGTLRVTCFNY